MAHDAPLEVFETLRYSVEAGYVRLDLHLARLSSSCAAFALPLDLDRLRRSLADQVPKEDTRVRIAVQDGKVTPRIDFFAMPATASHWTVAIHPDRVDETDMFRAHKTNRRAIYDEARQSLLTGIDEWIFLNTSNQVCEGTITNVFLDGPSGILTPPTSAGALPGVLRRSLIDTKQAQERNLTLQDLKDTQNTLFVGNALRGLIPVTLVAL